MQLENLNAAPSGELVRRIEQIRVVKLMYVHTGRNAWWSTWSARYYDGCMHTSWDSAKSYCDRHRLQGTVFYITELPAIAFMAGPNGIFVTEINTHKPLAEVNTKLLSATMSLIPIWSITLEQVAYIFDAHSPVWPDSHPKQSSVILTYGSPLSELAICEIGSEMVSKKSKAVGSEYVLSWVDQAQRADQNEAVRIGQMLESARSSG